MKHILIVCTGNTCRSSMAEALLGHLLEKEGLGQEYMVSSAGTSVGISRPASSNAVAALRDIGIDLSGHASAPVTGEMLDNADLVLTMTAAHKSWLMQLKPESAGKIFMLKEYCGGRGDVSDPFGGDQGVYCDCRDEIKDILIKLVERLKGKESI